MCVCVWGENKKCVCVCGGVRTRNVCVWGGENKKYVCGVRTRNVCVCGGGVRTRNVLGG